MTRNHHPRHSVRRRLQLSVAVLAAAALLAACGGDSEGSVGFELKHEAAESPAATDLPEAEDGVGTIKIASLPIPHNAQFIALPEFAKKYGLDVEWQSFQRYSDTQLAVAKGDVAVAAAGYHTVALDTAPTGVSIVAGGNSGAQALVLRPDDEVDDWNDLAGLKIGVAPNSGPDIQFQLSAREAGFDPNSIERVNFTTLGPATLTGLRNEEIDGILCWEVICAQAVENGSAVYSSLDIGANDTQNANTLALANDDWLADYPNAATLLVRAYVDAVDYFNEYPDELVALMMQETGAPAEVVEESLNSITLEWQLYRDRALATARAYNELGVSKRDMSDVVEDSLDYTYLMNATGLSKTEVGQ